MFTINFNKYLIKSQVDDSTIEQIKKDFKIHSLINILLILIFTTVFLNTRSNIFNVFFFVAILFYCYNLFTGVRDYTNLKIYFKLKAFDYNKGIEEFITDEKDFILEINKEIEKVIKPVAPVPVLVVAEEDFTKAIKEIENTNIISASTTINNNLIPKIDEVFSNTTIENIINPNLKMKAKQKLKQIEKTQELKGNFKGKIEECLNYVSVSEYGAVTGSYCKNKYCPVCSKAKEFKNKILIEELLKNFSDKTILFATFTTKTITVKSINEVKEQREKLTKAYSKLIRKLKNVTGYIKKIEVVYNEETNKLNIHIHAILLIKNYANSYITQKKWLEYWQEATGDNTIKQVKIILINKEEKSLKKLSSYVAKENLDKMKISDEISNLFEIAEEKKRDLTFGGEFKEAKKVTEAEMKKNRKQYAKSIGDKLVNLYWSREQNTYIN